MLTRRYHPPARAVNANSLTREFAAVAAPAASGTPTNSTVPFGVYELEHAAAALPSIKLVSGREPDEWRVNAYGTRVARDGDERDTGTCLRRRRGETGVRGSAERARLLLRRDGALVALADTAGTSAFEHPAREPPSRGDYPQAVRQRTGQALQKPSSPDTRNVECERGGT